jgi:hypothetical protein
MKVATWKVEPTAAPCFILYFEFSQTARLARASFTPLCPLHYNVAPPRNTILRVINFFCVWNFSPPVTSVFSNRNRITVRLEIDAERGIIILVSKIIKFPRVKEFMHFGFQPMAKT